MEDPILLHAIVDKACLPNDPIYYISLGPIVQIPKQPSHNQYNYHYNL
jgi:hypothetical protein